MCFFVDKLLGGFKGAGGSVRSIQCHPTLNYFTSVGLDRFIRVFDLKTRKQKFKVRNIV